MHNVHTIWHSVYTCTHNIMFTHTHTHTHTLHTLHTLHTCIEWWCIIQSHFNEPATCDQLCKGTQHQPPYGPTLCHPFFPLSFRSLKNQLVGSQASRMASSVKLTRHTACYLAQPQGTLVIQMLLYRHAAVIKVCMWCVYARLSSQVHCHNTYSRELNLSETF